MTRTQANLVLLLAGAMWGMGFVAQSTAMQAIGPLLFIGSRFLVATIAMLPFAIREGRRAERKVHKAEWLAFAMIGVLLFAGMAAQQIGLLTTTVTNSGFLTGLYVIMVPFIAVMFFRQWPHPLVWPAALSALFGIWLLSGGSIGAFRTGDWLTILCALIWAFQVIYTGKYAAGSGRPVTLAVTQFTVCGVIALLFAAFLEPIGWEPVRAALPEILYAGVIAGGAAFTLQAVGQRYTTAPQAAIFLSTEAVFAALFGAVFLGERLPLEALAGCALIFAAILLVELGPVLLSRRRFAARG